MAPGSWPPIVREVQRAAQRPPLRRPAIRQRSDVQPLVDHPLVERLLATSGRELKPRRNRQVLHEGAEVGGHACLVVLEDEVGVGEVEPQIVG
jgi:hypothetical protein